MRHLTQSMQTGLETYFKQTAFCSWTNDAISPHLDNWSTKNAVGSSNLALLCDRTSPFVPIIPFAWAARGKRMSGKLLGVTDLLSGRASIWGPMVRCCRLVPGCSLKTPICFLHSGVQWFSQIVCILVVLCQDLVTTEGFLDDQI